jgi:hypothetical protein
VLDGRNYGSPLCMNQLAPHCPKGGFAIGICICTLINVGEERLVQNGNGGCACCTKALGAGLYERCQLATIK